MKKRVLRQCPVHSICNLNKNGQIKKKIKKEEKSQKALPKGSQVYVIRYDFQATALALIFS